MKFFLLFFLSVKSYAQPQNYIFQHLSTKDGLMSEHVTGILHDLKGFTWVGTSRGLQKFDGNKFTTIPFGDDYFYNGIMSATIFIPVLEDKLGNIWVQINSKLAVYEPLTGKIKRILVSEKINPHDLNNIRSLAKDDQGEVWITTSHGLYKYDNHLQAVTLWFSFAKGALFFSNLVFDKFNRGFWFTLNGQMVFFNINERRTDKSLPDFFPADLSNVICSWLDSKRILWVSRSNATIYKINTVTRKMQVYVLHKSGADVSAVNITAGSFAEDKKGVTWVATSYGGLFYLDDKTNKFKEVQGSNRLPNSLHYDYEILTVKSDDEGNIWIGSDKGINIFNPSRQQIQTIDENNLLQPFAKAQITQVFETSTGDLLIGTWGKGWYIYDNNFNLKRRFDLKFLPHTHDYRKNLVWSFAEAIDGKIWIGYQHGLLGIYDTVTKSITYIDEPGLMGKTVRIMRRDAQGNIWFGLQSGYLGKWDRLSHTFKFYYSIIAETNKVPTAISDILVSPDGGIWVATLYNGFYYFDPVKEIATRQHPVNNRAEALDSIICSLTLLNDSIIGISTSAKGFQLFNRLRNTVTSFNKKNALPTNEIYGIEQDKQKNIWIASFEGLYRKNNINNEIVSFGEQDGLLNKHFKERIYKLKDGRMVLPTSSGFIYFLPEEFDNAPTPPRIRLTGFKIFDRSLLIDSLLQVNKSVNLRYNDNFITIGYSSLSFTGRNTTRYFYQLTGVDKDWVNAGSLQSAAYTGLNPGHYTFKVKSVNREGISSKEIISLAIHITPPWWLTWWAYSLYGCILCATVFFIYSKRISSLQYKQKAEIKAMVTTQEGERKRISRDLHDDVGTKLSALKLFISSLYEKAKTTGNEEIKSLAKSSEQFITEAMQDVRQILLNLSPTVLEEFGYTTAVEGLVNKINETKQITFTLVVFGMKQRLQNDYELALYRITQELINNVLKHAGAKNVSLQIGQRDNKIILMIEDDGRGFDVEAHKDGYGLRNLDARTKLMQGTMIIDSTAGKGTSVLIEIPYNFKDK